MDWTEAILGVINLRSFSSLWYWIAVAVLWSSVSHWVLGVPFDLITRARRKGGEAEQDLIDITRVNVNRLLTIQETSAYWLIGIASFVVSSLLILSFFYDVEFAQALCFLVIPLCAVGALSFRDARKIRDEVEDVQMLYRALSAHRLWTQGIGMVSIFLTALYGMLQNLELLRHDLSLPPF